MISVHLLKISIISSFVAPLPVNCHPMERAAMGFHMAVGKTQINRMQTAIVKMSFGCWGCRAGIGGDPARAFRVISDDGLQRHSFITCL